MDALKLNINERETKLKISTKPIPIYHTQINSYCILQILQYALDCMEYKTILVISSKLKKFSELS